MPYIVDCQFWLIYPALFLFVGFITMELPKIVRESSIERRNKKVEEEMSSMGWTRCTQAVDFAVYKKDGIYVGSFYDDPEKVISAARRVDKSARATDRVLAQYMEILNG